MKTDTITDRVIVIDHSLSLEAMIAAGKYDWKNDDITAERFPIEGSGTKKFSAKVFHFDRRISSEDAVAAMEKEQFAPATHIHGLAFGAAFPEEQRKYPIACLGSSARVRGSRGVVCLSGGGGGRCLDLCGWRGGWYDRWRFLAVQEVSEA
jgi:hypothetical protein